MMTIWIYHRLEYLHLFLVSSYSGVFFLFLLLHRNSTREDNKSLTALPQKAAFLCPGVLKCRVENLKLPIVSAKADASHVRIDHLSQSMGS